MNDIDRAAFVADYFSKYAELVSGRSPSTTPGPVPSEPVFETIERGQVDVAWEMVQALIAAAPNRDAFQFVAAGVFEDLLAQAGDEIIESVAASAQSTPQIVEALRYMYVDRMSPNVQRRIRELTDRS